MTSGSIPRVTSERESVLERISELGSPRLQSCLHPLTHITVRLKYYNYLQPLPVSHLCTQL